MVYCCLTTSSGIQHLRTTIYNLSISVGQEGRSSSTGRLWLQRLGEAGGQGCGHLGLEGTLPSLLTWCWFASIPGYFGSSPDGPLYGLPECYVMAAGFLSVSDEGERDSTQDESHSLFIA